MRDRLIELILNFENELDKKHPHTGSMDRIEATADHLLANGVIVPPVKVGTTIYEAILLKRKRFSHFRECKVVGYHTGEFPDLRGHKRNNYLIVYYDCGHLGHIPYDKIGKTLFLTCDAAERALEELKNDGRS